MLIVTDAYNDFSADMIDTDNGFKRVHKTEQEIIETAKDREVYGAIIIDGEIQYLNQYNCNVYETRDTNEDDYEQISSRIINCGDIRVAIRERNEPLKKVEYCIYCVAGDDITYVGERSKYSKTISGAKKFNKYTAKEVAHKMNQRSKTGKHWSYSDAREILNKCYI